MVQNYQSVPIIRVPIIEVPLYWEDLVDVRTRSGRRCDSISLRELGVPLEISPTDLNYNDQVGNRKTFQHMSWRFLR